MILSDAKNVLKDRISRYGSTLTSGADFKAILTRGNVSYDRPTSEFVAMAPYDATIDDGQVITGPNGNRFVPTMIDNGNIGTDMYRRVYMRRANASGDFKQYVDPVNASKDAWDQPTGSLDIDYGWVTRKSSAWACFESRSLSQSGLTDAGAVSEAVFHVFVPWSVNASYTPAMGGRFVDRNGAAWRIEGVDSMTHQGQAYVVRMSPDEG